MSTAVKRASFATEDMKEGSSLFDNVRGVVVAGKFTKEAPDNYTADGNPIFAVLKLRLALEKTEGESDEDHAARINQAQSYSCGAQSGDNFTISPDGDYLIPNTDESAIRKDCKFGTLATSLQREGVSKTVMADFAFSKIVGLDGQWKRIADKERTFAEERQARGGPGKKKSFPPSTLCLVKLYALSGETAATKPNGKAKSAIETAPAGSTAPAADVSGEDLDTETFGFLEGVLKTAAAKGKTVQRSQLTLLLSRAAAASPNKQAIARRGPEEAFLASMVATDLINYDPAASPQVVSLAA